MSVLVSSLTNLPHTSYFSNNSSRRINENLSQTKQNRLKTKKLNDHDQNKDHVPYGVVNSMKQRLLNKVNESFLLNNNNNNNNNNSTLLRHSLSKPSSRLSSHENLLQTKPFVSPLKHTTRLSRSQDNLTNSNSNQSEQFNSYIQPKQDVIIVDTTTNETHSEDEGKLSAAQKTSIHRQSYTELHVDEAPKPGTVTTVKNMFERQIRLSRYDADKLFNSSTPGSSRMSSQHREISSPTRSRSTSPNDMAVRQRRTTTMSGSSLPLTSTTLLLPVPTSYPDVVISHTPPTETNKNLNESTYNENLAINNQQITKEKKIFLSNRNTISHEHIPLNVIVDETSTNLTNHHRPNLLLPSTVTSETVDSQPLDFKSRLALFNRTNTQRTNENLNNTKKSLNSLLTKPVIHHPTRSINEEKKDLQPEINHNQPLSIPISRSVVNTAKAVTFFGGNKLNGNTKSSLPNSIPPPPPPPVTSQINNKNEQLSIPTSIDLLHAPNIIGGNVKLNKSSMFSGTKKDARVQFIDNVDTFEYPSFEVAMAELGGTGSDDDNEREGGEDDDDPSSTSSNDDNNNNGKINGKKEELINKKKPHIDDVDDDELERLARINAEFNTNNLAEKPLKPKGTLHTFRPTHLDQYELGTQHGSLPITKSSDISTSKNSYSILARQKLQTSSDTSTKNLIYKQQKSTFDMPNNIQWSSMSTTTDLLF